MEKSELFSRLICPVSKELLSYSEPETYLSQIAEGKLGLSCGEAFPDTVTGILTTESQTYIYPVIKGVPILVEGYHIVACDNMKIASNSLDEIVKEQLKQMEKFSNMHAKYYDQVTEAQQKVLRENYYHLCHGCSVLDVGNGGLSAEAQVGKEHVHLLKNFIALDRSYHMITRNGVNGGQIIGDAFHLPFADNSVDYVSVNGVLHHFGKKKEDVDGERISSFMKEAMRVASKGLICLELTIPAYAQAMENIVLSFAKEMPTYVYSKKALLRIIEDTGFIPEKVICKRIGQMLPPLTVVPPILDYEWLKVPVGILPYYMLYFYLRK